MYKSRFLFILLMLFSFSCGDDFYELNEDIKNPAEVPGESLFTSAQKSLVDQMVSTNVNFNIFRLFAQYWTETTYIDESNYDLVTRNIPEQHWSELFRKTLRNFDESAQVMMDTEILPEDEGLRQNKLAVTEIMSVYTWAVLVESFGDIPYTQALNIETLLPVYDDGDEIYRDLLTRLDAAIANLHTDEGSFGLADNIYQGDTEAWMKFAMSLKLRMGMTLADSDPALSQSVVEAAAPGVFTSNDDNAVMDYLAATPNTNPLYVDLVASGRSDFVPANTIVDAMNDLGDPRRVHYFDSNLRDDVTGDVIYSGGIYGDNNTFSLYTHIGPELERPTFGGTILSYAETEFLLAEAIERGYNVGGTAEEHYSNGISASFMEWGNSMTEAQDYLSRPEVAYATAAGDWKEKIGTQMWLALYNRGYAAWLAQRRLDYPQLVAPPEAVSDLPVRLTYPIVEQTLNGANWTSASDAIGGDAVTTKLFFDMY